MRKEKFVTLQDGDNEVMFKITQMPAMQQARWASKVMIMLCSDVGIAKNFNAFEIDKLQKQFKKEGLAMVLAIIGTLDYDKVEPLLNELLACCAHVPDKNKRNFVVNITADNVDSVIGDFTNIYRLAIEAFKVNFTFSAPGSLSPTRKKADITFTKRT